MQSPTKSSIIIILSVAFSSLTLWLIDSWIKYPLFLFEIVVFLVFYVIVNNYKIRLLVKHRGKLEPAHLDIALSIDGLMIVIALILFVISTCGIRGGVFQVILALLITSLFPGYALSNIFGLSSYFSKLEIVVVSYLLSYCFTGFMTSVSFSITETMRTQFVLSILVALGLISALKHRRHVFSLHSKSFSKDSDLLSLLVIVAFYGLSFYFIYPGFAYLPYTDISDHYRSSIILGRMPSVYKDLTYLLAHLYESMFLSLSNTSLAFAQTALLLSTFMLPLTFYVMAKKYLEKIDGRLPSLATLFWSLFTNSFGGFAWLQFAKLKFSETSQTQIQLLASTADKTYNGTIYGILGLWYSPAVVSFVMLMAALFFIRKKEIPKLKYFALFSVTIAAMYLTHVTEAVIFTLFLATYGSISRNKNLRITDSMRSSLIGLLIVTTIYLVYSFLNTRYIFSLSLLIALLGSILALLFSLMSRRIRRPRLTSIKIWFETISRHYILSKALVIAPLFVYIIVFLSWDSLIESFQTSQINAVGLVPWFMYILMLGVNGLLAILAFHYIIHDRKHYKNLTLFIAFIIFTLIAGKVVSIINIHLFDVGYSEKRFIWFIKLSLSALAPIPIIVSIDRIKKKHIHINIKTLTSAIMIGTVVLYGVSTTFLNLEYWNITTSEPANQPSIEEMRAIDNFRKILDNDRRAWLITVSTASNGIATFAAPADRLGLKQLLYTAYTPEMVFTQLYRHPVYTHSYIYLHNRDLSILDEVSDRFFAQHLTTFPLVFNNSEVKIYNASKPSFPQPHSDNALIIPLRNLFSEKDVFFAYNILSEGFYDYTVFYDLDDKALKATNVILAFDPPEGDILAGIFQDKFNYSLQTWNILKGNWLVEDGKLLVDESENGEGIILSPKSAENFKATFEITPLRGDVDVQKYVSLVYSWKDATNYRIADLMFGSDGNIYVHFREYVEGKETVFPEWPGVQTGLRWQLGDQYDVTVTVNETLNQISINNKTFLSLDLANVGGRIGLRYFRFNKVLLDNFSVNYTIQVKGRPIEDYLNFLDSGGKAILLNTNGYGFFAGELFQISNSTLYAKRIEGQTLNVNLPAEIQVPKLRLKNGTTFIAGYTTSTETAPFISSKNYGEGTLFYINIYPIVKALGENSPQPFYAILGKLLDDLNLTKLNTEIIPKIEGYVNEIHLNENVKVETNSLLFPSEFELEQVVVKTKKYSQTFRNVTSIMISEYSRVMIEANNATIESGNGLYARLNINSTFFVKPYEGFIDLEITANNEEISMTEINQISITQNNTIQLLTRTPTIQSTSAIFVEFYPQGSLRWRTRTYGQNLKVTGSTEFSVMFSDSYSALENIKLGSLFQRDPPIVMFDFFSTFQTAIFWTLLILPIFIGIFFVFWSKNTRAK